ncbi:MAG: sugar transferase [Spirochaetes bacterium]|nr:sugar transferase [Spirochaetota bacterium]MBL7006984.1 sugar transferase [Spirochaetia bacterium]
MLQQYQSKGRKFRKERVKRTLWLMVIKATLLFKRLVDILATIIALLLLSPLFLAVSLLIKFTDGGPVFYVQTRIGKHGKHFPFPKFRSMVLNADKMKDDLLKQADRIGDITFKMKRDPRVTRIGRFIRRFSIDELPQLWCVLKGDMSLVGPRPPVPREVALYTQEDRRRLEVTPGLTGIWQVSGRAEIEFKQQVELDVLYIESHGFWLDILLMLKTIPAVFTGKGAY